jgi:hypothetical protein
LGQPTQVEAVGQSNPYAWSATYHPNGALASFVYGNGERHETEQNLRGLPARNHDWYLDGSGQEVGLLDDSYSYDGTGNITAIADGLPAHSGNRAMQYDGLDRLTDVVSPLYGTTGAHYAYDALDNLTHVVAPGRNHWYCYDGRNLLTNLKTGSCTGTTEHGLGYDVRGNLQNKDGRTFAFDYGNRLREVRQGNDPGVLLESYRYDGLGRRSLAYDPLQGSILSQYSQDGRLRMQSDQRRGKTTQYLYLGGWENRGQSTFSDKSNRRLPTPDRCGKPIGGLRLGGNAGLPPTESDKMPRANAWSCPAWPSTSSSEATTVRLASSKPPTTCATCRPCARRCCGTPAKCMPMC